MSLTRKERWFAVITVTWSILLAALLLEGILRVLEHYRGRNLPDYKDTWRLDDLGPGGFLKSNLDIYVKDGYGGKVRWVTNSAGFRNEREFAPEPPQGVWRILSLGDSFTAGYRVGQEDTYSFLLEKWLNQAHGPTEVLVSCIEEPFTGFLYLKQFGVNFHPHVVLLGLTLGNDMAQSYFSLSLRENYRLLGIPEAQIPSGLPDNWQERVKAWREPLIPSEYLKPRAPLEEVFRRMRRSLARLRLAKLLNPRGEGILSAFGDEENPRLFDPVNGLGVYLQPAPPEIEEAYRRLFLALAAFRTFCQERGISLVVFLFPQRFQVNPRDWDRAVAKYRLKASGFNLMAPNNRIREFCRQQGIQLLDPTEAMGARYQQTGKSQYFSLGDMHWNAEGNRAFFEAVRGSLGELAAESFKKLK